MSNEQILTTILLMGVVFGLLGKFFFDRLVDSVNQVKEIMENNRKFKAKMAEMDRMKAAGEFHEWVDVPSSQGTMLVCKKTGWAPSLKGFVPLSAINAYLEQLQAEKDYKEYRAARVQLLAHELQLTVPMMETVVEKVFSMKKDFHVERIAKLQQELAAKAAVVNGTKKV